MVKKFYHIPSYFAYRLFIGIGFIIFLIGSESLSGQSLNTIDILIRDTVLVKKSKQDVVKLKIKLSTGNDDKCDYPILIKNFYRIVPANIFFFDKEPIL